LRLVVTLEGLPLGIAAAKAWTRKKFKGCMIDVNYSCRQN